MKKNEEIKNKQSEEPKEDVSSENTDSVCSSDEMLKQLTKAEEEAKKHYDHLLRVMAEFENYKKRISKEKDEFVKFAAEPLMNDLIVIIEDMQRVESHVDKDAPPQTKAVLEGVMMVHGKLMKLLEANGLKQIEVGETFNPAIHEAIAYVPSNDHESGQIIQVQRNGYTLHDRLIRPAQVVVSKGKG